MSQTKVELIKSGAKLDNCTTDGTTNFTIADGNLVVGTAGHGISFSAASNVGGMTSELLDDYEHGTWVPTSNVGSITTYSAHYVIELSSYIKMYLQYGTTRLYMTIIL